MTTRDEWIEDAADVLGQLRKLAADASWPVGTRSVAWAAAELLNVAPAALGTSPAPSSKVVPEVAPAKPTEGHRHKYGDDGRCTLAMPGGSGICTAMARAAKKVATLALPGTTGGGS